jgi:hypothetical protein
MLTLVSATILAVAFCLGAVAGFCKTWLEHKPVETKVFYCTTTNMDPRCVEARERLKQASANPPLSTDAPQSTPREARSSHE